MSIYRRIANLFSRASVEREIDAELQSHIEMRIEDNLAAGMSAEAARRDALLRFGNRAVMKEKVTAMDTALVLEGILFDVRYAWRQLRKSPGFAVTSVVTLALAIGANAVVFSLLNALVLHPLNVPDAQSLYVIERGSDHSPSQSYPDYRDLRDRNRSFSSLAFYDIAPAGLNSDGNPAPVWLYETSGNYFDALGIQPYLGRFFHSSDEHGPDSAPYIVLSYAYWQSHFQGDPKVVGRAVQVNKFPFTILGVAPPKFRGTEVFYAPDLWVPVVNQKQVEGWSELESRATRGMLVVGHLKSGVTPAQATADLNAIGAALAKQYPKDDDAISFTLTRPGLYGDMLGGPVRAFVAALMLLAGLILLAACANLGSLFAARAADRSREVALRLALGSSRKRIVRQLLTEATLVSLAGGALGMMGGVLLLRWISAWQPVPNMPINVPVNPDARTYLVALLLALVSGLFFGMVPVRQVLRSDAYQVIKTGASGVAGNRRFTLRDLLLAGQIAVCAVLVTSSLVAARGMVRSLHSNFGFVPQNTMQVSTDLDMAGYSGDQVPLMQRRMLDAVSAIPGVTAAGYASRIPLNLGWGDSTVFADSTTDYRSSKGIADAMEYAVSPGYFQAAGTTLLAGRSFTWHDDQNSPHTAVVNQEFARKVFGSEQQALGGHFKMWGGTRVEVVGIVEDGKYKTLSEDPQPAMFLSILQSPTSSMWLLVRSNRGPAEAAAAIDRTLRRLDSGLPLTITTWYKALDTALFAARAATIALGVLGCLGAMLAITGIFGMAAYTVSKRLRELGIRIALGAQRGEVLRAALGRVFRLLAFGSAAGVVLGLAATKVLSFIVYQATPRDPVVLAGVIAAMLALGLLAAWIPAQRALAADPLILLREE